MNLIIILTYTFLSFTPIVHFLLLPNSSHVILFVNVGMVKNPNFQAEVLSHFGKYDEIIVVGFPCPRTSFICLATVLKLINTHCFHQFVYCSPSHVLKKCPCFTGLPAWEKVAYGCNWTISCSKHIKLDLILKQLFMVIWF